ncbi:MAG: hypothetical protein IJ896_04315 [Fibrobacter sp.]|nr:hypothetical protein [Fibrobacter sp.]
MWPILLGSDKRLFVKLATALLVAFSLLPAEEPADSLLLQMTASQDSVATAQNTAVAQDSTTAQDSTLAAPMDTLSSDSGGVAGEVSPDTSKNCFSVDLSTGEVNPSDSDKSGLEIATPSARNDVGAERNGNTCIPVTEANQSGALRDDTLPSGHKKSVLYLSGGERSPWFHLGVLYAIENYKVRIDSVVGTSWGAFVGYLWAHGMTLDDIQRILLDPHLQGYVGHNMFDDLYNKKPEQAKWPIASNGVPSLRYRFALEPDTSMTLRKIPKSIEPDTTVQRYALAKLRLQEAMNRVPRGAVIPFKVLGCNGEEWETAEDVFKSLPLIENYNSGELCPGLAVPYEDVYDQVPIISVGIPRVAKASVSSWNSPWQRILFEKPLQNLSYQESGVVLRAHYATDSSYTAWIQAGFSALERHATELIPFRNDSLDYTTLKKVARPWFKFKPSFDSLSAETHSTIASYWDESDTGMVAPENFLEQISKEPAYDSVSFDMLPTGNVLVDAKVSPTVDIALGGFGSSAIGPHAYGDMTLSFVNQMNIALGVSGFVGPRSYGVSPRLEVSHLWNRDWTVGLRYDWRTLKPLWGYLDDNVYPTTPRGEKRSDFNMWVNYSLTRTQIASLNFMLGDRTLDFSSVYRMDNLETWPVSPSLQYRYAEGDTDPFFAYGGQSVFLEWGLQSVRYKIELADLIPIYHKLTLEMFASRTPLSFLTVGIFLGGGMDMFHDEGRGYVYPKSTGLKPLDNFYRRSIAATPWTGEWYNPELLSHHYGLARINLGVHKGFFGMWVFGAYVRDFEENPTSRLGQDKYILEPTIRLSYKSISVSTGMSRLVDQETLEELGDVMDYTFFIRVGNYSLF